MVDEGDQQRACFTTTSKVEDIFLLQERESTSQLHAFGNVAHLVSLNWKIDIFGDVDLDEENRTVEILFGRVYPPFCSRPGAIRVTCGSSFSGDSTTSHPTHKKNTKKKRKKLHWRCIGDALAMHWTHRMDHINHCQRFGMDMSGQPR